MASMSRLISPVLVESSLLNQNSWNLFPAEGEYSLKAAQEFSTGKWTN